MSKALSVLSPSLFIIPFVFLVGCGEQVSPVKQSSPLPPKESKTIHISEKEPYFKENSVNEGIGRPAYNPECDKLYRKTYFNRELDVYLDRAVELASLGQTFAKARDFQLNYLNQSELVEFYGALRFCELDGNNIFSKLAFEAKDEIIRRSKKNLSAKVTFLQNLGERDRALFFPEKTSFLELEEAPLSKVRLGPLGRIIRAGQVKGEVRKDRAIHVLHAGVEAPNVRVGGIGAFLDGLVRAENASAIDARVITPFFDFLKRKLSKNTRFIGFLPHFVEGVFYESSLYESTQDGYVQYLVQPDPSYDGFGLYQSDQVSEVYSHFSSPKTLLYHSSAVAAFSTLYHEGDGVGGVDVLHLNGWHLGLSAVLLDEVLNGIRKNAHLSKVSLVSTTHILNGDQGEKDAKYLSRLGLPAVSKSTVNLHLLTQLHSDMSNAVSQGVAIEMRSPERAIGFGMGRLFEFLHTKGRFFPIQNGIDYYGKFDVRNQNLLQQFSVAQDLSDLKTKKEEAKRILARLGLIGSAEKPLFLYVGRFATEKGVDVLPEFVRFVLDRNAQAVVMGTPADASARNVLRELEEIHHSDFKFYQDLQKDQLAFIPELYLTKGSLIRFAADFTIIPSKNESFGLVALEALAMGSAVITSYVQGLKDMCFPYGRVHEGSQFGFLDFNAFAFDRHSLFLQTLQNMKQAIQDGLTFWEALGDTKRQEARVRWIKTAESYRWDKPGGSVDQYRMLYRRAMDLSEEDKAKQRSEFSL